MAELTEALSRIEVGLKSLGRDSLAQALHGVGLDLMRRVLCG
jgi:hypothetical protein